MNYRLGPIYPEDALSFIVLGGFCSCYRRLSALLQDWPTEVLVLKLRKRGHACRTQSPPKKRYATASTCFDAYRVARGLGAVGGSYLCTSILARLGEQAIDKNGRSHIQEWLPPHILGGYGTTQGRDIICPTPYCLQDAVNINKWRGSGDQLFSTTLYNHSLLPSTSELGRDKDGQAFDNLPAPFGNTIRLFLLRVSALRGENKKFFFLFWPPPPQAFCGILLGPKACSCKRSCPLFIFEQIVTRPYRRGIFRE